MRKIERAKKKKEEKKRIQGCIFRSAGKRKKEEAARLL